MKKTQYLHARFAIKGRWPVTLLVLFAAIFGLGIYRRPELEKVPVQRLLDNLTAQADKEPDNATLQLNLARVHGMAYSLKTEEVEVNKQKPDLPWFGFVSPDVPFSQVVELSETLAKERNLDQAGLKKLQAAAKEHLDQSIAHFRRAVELDKDDMAARLGLAWTLDQAGQDEEAIERYRKVLDDAWEKEKDLKSAGIKFHSVVAEVAEYLRPHLDAEADKQELAELDKKVSKVNKILRPITPIAIPLGPHREFSDVYDADARVRFDADGSGTPDLWSWTTPDAGWLVYDGQGLGRIDSALQMFGGVSFWCFWENGFEALAALDDDGDGQLVGKELRGLAIWHDRNQNGISEPGEVGSVESHGFRSIHCGYVRSQFGRQSICWNPVGFERSDGTTVPAYDLLLQRAPQDEVRPKKEARPEKEARAEKNVLFFAGGPSHSYGAHEHYAGCVLLAQNLEVAMPNFKTTVVRTEWPDEQTLANADAIVMYCDGGDGHPVNKHLEQIDALADKGVGIVCLHYGVEVPKGESGDKFLKWIGGYFETDWSVNPEWTADFKQLPKHPITRGIEPFSIQDEWYYHMRFRPDMAGVTPILTAVPPASTLDRPDGSHSGNRFVCAEAGQPQHVAWAAEREGGGRGFGFTGGHYHWNWGQPTFRRLVLNAIVWCARRRSPCWRRQSRGTIDLVTTSRKSRRTRPERLQP